MSCTFVLTASDELPRIFVHTVSDEFATHFRPHGVGCITSYFRPHGIGCISFHDVSPVGIPRRYRVQNELHSLSDLLGLCSLVYHMVLAKLPNGIAAS